VVYVSLVILVYQGIANSNLGIISQFTHQNGNNWAGPLSTALLFLGSGLGCSYNKYIGKYPFKYCFFVGSLGFILYTALGLIFLKLGFTTTVEVLIFALSFIAGGTCSIFYNTQFNYINFLSRIDKREVKYFGINIGMAQSSNIFGNLVSAMLIKPLGQFLAVLVMTIIMMISAILLLFARQP
jgi:predicted MFS family arabinose efflux permease